MSYQNKCDGQYFFHKKCSFVKIFVIIMTEERQQFKIAPAKSLQNLYQNLQITSGLSEENMAFHVPLYQEQIDEIVQKLAFSYNPRDTFFVAGQTGSGKTTLIDFLVYSHQEVKDKYEFLYVDYAEETLQDDKEFGVGEVLSVLITKIARIGYSFGIDMNEYLKKLKAIEEDSRKQSKDEAVSNWNWSDIFLEIVANSKIGLGLKLDTARRSTIRSIFKSNLKDFVDLLNALIVEVNYKHPDGKLLLIFMDGLEKIQDAGIIHNIFSRESLFAITNIECRKIMAIPVHLASRDTSAIDPSIGHFVAVQCKIKTNPLTENNPDVANEDKERSKNQVAKNRENLKQLIRKRIDIDSQTMLPDDALDFALDKSGGFVVDLCKILTDAIIKAAMDKSLTVRIEHVRKAADYLGAIKSQSFTLDSKAISALYHIFKTSKKDNEDNNQTLIKHLLLKNIIFNLNHTLCYFVHPLIEVSVDIYGQNTASNS
jgi:energy-coupling factor transporter ATP-binding protein EcfA2